MNIRYAVGLPTVGEFGDPNVLVELAVLAEESGWDGVYLWDHVLYHDPVWPVANPTVTAAAIAVATRRVRLIVMHVLPRRRTQIVARESVTLDTLSRGRLILAAAIGSMDLEYAGFGESPRGRGAALDIGLADLCALWSGEPVVVEGGSAPVQMRPVPVQWPRIPIWCGGRWPNRAPLRRAARFDGAMPTFPDQNTRVVPPAEFAEAATCIGADRGGLAGFDLALEGASEPGGAPATAAGYAEHGLTWWVEAMGWWRAPAGAHPGGGALPGAGAGQGAGVAAARTRIAAGP